MILCRFISDIFYGTVAKKYLKVFCDKKNILNGNGFSKGLKAIPGWEFRWKNCFFRYLRSKILEDRINKEQHAVLYYRIRVITDPYFAVYRQNLWFFPHTGKHVKEKTRILAYFTQNTVNKWASSFMLPLSDYYVY